MNNNLVSMVTKRIADRRSLQLFVGELSRHMCKKQIEMGKIDPDMFNGMRGPDYQGGISPCPQEGVAYESSKICPSDYNCNAVNAFDCETFTCQDNYNCVNKIDYLCGLKFECVKDHDCEGGHGFFCTEDNECTGGFVCKGGGGTWTDVDCGDATHTYGGMPGMNTTPGDFICALPRDTPDFDCIADFKCESTDDFACIDEFDCDAQSADFDCGTAADFGCGYPLDEVDCFDCNTRYDCLGRVDCNGATDYAPPST